MRGSEDEFEVRLGRIRSPSGARRVESFFKSVGRRSRRFGRSARRRSRTPNRQAFSQFQRRVMIKVSLVRMNMKGLGAQRLHLDYIERDGTSRSGERAELYSAKDADVSKTDFIARGAEDRHQFRVIISPEDGRELERLTDFTRDLVAQMEADLETRFDWVAANHYDTDQPHTHLVISGRRDDGRDLVIPRDYISRGIRQRAEALVELELGPVTELEGRLRIARMIEAERWTPLDHDLTRNVSGAGELNLKRVSDRIPAWRQRLMKRRLHSLARMGLAEQAPGGIWRLQNDMRATLQRMGERGDIIKRLHRAMNETSSARLQANSLFDPSDTNTQAVTGRVVAKGIADDVAGRAFLIVESTDGRSVYAESHPQDAFHTVRKGQIVTLAPPQLEPRSSDHTIARIAGRNTGIYSMQAHLEDDPKARPAFVEAHLRRLEALRRAGHVTRQADGRWRVPDDYMNRVRSYEQAMARRRPLAVTTHSHLTLEQMTQAMGANWLDRDWVEHPEQDAHHGFASEVRQARQARAAFLIREGVVPSEEGLTERHLRALQRRDLTDAGKSLGQSLGKPYVAAPHSGRIDGHYVKAIDRPSGRFAVIERAKDFTLVPWRPVMDRNLGKQISGVMRGDQISWTLTKGRGIS